jgi:hypothetical protein
VSSALADFARKNVEIVAVNGGDGTIQAVLTALFHDNPFSTLPLLAILRSGTTSMTAGDVGLRGSALHGLGKLMGWAKTRNSQFITRRHVLSVEAPGQAPLCGMFLGGASICQGIRYFHAKVNSLGFRGELMPGLVIARFLLDTLHGRSQHVSPSTVNIGVNGASPERWDCLVILASTLERLFLGMRPFWGTGSGPVHFSAVSTNPQNLLQALPNLLRGRRGRHGTAAKGYLSHNVDELQLTLDSEFALDGEFYTPDTRRGPVVIRSGGTASFLRL